MGPVSVTIAICNFVCGLVFLGIGIPLAKGRVSRNHLYGFRFPKAFASEDNWQQINRLGGRRMLLWTPLVFLSAVLPIIIPVDDNPYLALALGLSPCIIMIPCLQAYRFSQRLPD